MYFSIDIQNAPADLAVAYAEEFEKAMGYTSTSHEADQVAMRSLRHRGWYNTVKGWKRLSPDIRTKVNIRKAEKQTDGRFMVRDVDVFYPNAVKANEDGIPIVYTAEDIRRRIENTNAAIKSGGQAPALSRGHPHPDQKLMGLQLPALGKGMNWRKSPRGAGWARCDLFDIDPEVMGEWKKGHWTGLSAGLVADANKTNERFGHIALLGVDSQALSNLPVTEVFSAANEEVCFSADAEAIQKGTFNMPTGNQAPNMSMGQKLFAAMGTYSTALASFAAGEPSAPQKVQDAFSQVQAAHKEFCGDMSTEDDGTTYASQEPQEESDMPKGELSNGGTGPGGDINVGPKGSFQATIPPNGVTFSAEQQAYLDQQQQQFAAQNEIIAKLKNTMIAMAGRMAKNDFTSYITNLRDQGHNFDTESALAAFDACAGSTKAIEALKTMLSKSPKSVLTGPNSESVFGVTGSGNANRTQNNAAAILSEAENILQNFGVSAVSDEEKALGAALTQGIFAGLGA